MDMQDIDNIVKKPTKKKPRGRKIRPRDKPKKPVAEIPSRMPLLVGYMRVSTEKQDMAMQYDSMIAAGIKDENIFRDTVSGSKVTRSGRDACLKFLIPGDTLVVWKIDRFSRSLKDLLNHLEEFDRAGIGFRSLTQAIDTTNPAGRMMMQIVGAFAEFEREMIRERVKAGIKAKRDAGLIGRWGKKPAVDYDSEEVRRLLRQKISQRQIAKTIGISKSTVSNINKAMKKKK